MPLIEPALFATKGFRYSLVICVAQTVGLFIGMLLIPLWIQHLLKLSPLWTGFALMSSAVVTGICSQPAGKYLDRYGAAKIMSLGLMITVASFLLLAWAPVQNVWFIVFCMILHGLGMGLSYMPSTTAGLNSLRQQQQHLVTQAAALNNLFRRIFACSGSRYCRVISSAKTTIIAVKYSSNIYIISHYAGNLCVLCNSYTLHFAFLMAFS